jgi:glycosyltransferase involved in cell wall biosynthesis
MKKIAIVIPAYNEEACVEELARRLKAVFDLESKYKWEVIFVENGSIDATFVRLLAINQSDKRFRVLQLSRNFRMDGGLTAGLNFVDADACVIMTADLQDPPEWIPEYLRKWEEGFENIYGVVEKRVGTPILRRINSRLFYKLAGWLSEGLIPKNASDFRLVDRKVYEAVREMNERNRFVRGLFAWVGFKSIGIPLVRPPRFGGVSNAHSLQVIDLAIKGIFGHSYKPLRLISIIGLFLSLISFASIAVISFLALTSGVPFAGFGTIVSLILGGIGIQALMLGIIGEYLALVYEESKHRPNYIVREFI